MSTSSPRTTRSSTRPRRSARFSDAVSGGSNTNTNANARSKTRNNVFVELEMRPKTKRRKISHDGDVAESSVAVEKSLVMKKEKEKAATPSSSKRTSSTTTTTTTPEARKLEKTMKRKEAEMTRKMNKLEDRLAAAIKREQEAANLIEDYTGRTRTNVFNQLEANFTCALCYEIMACPYSLNPSQCGHSFCAVCTLKWFFSRLHRTCGTWHEHVDCPICRACLVLTPEPVPRPIYTFPFAPNRVAESVLRDSLATLAGLEDKKAKVKGKGREVHPPVLPEWREGGIAKLEWLRRDRQGRDEMNYLAENWASLVGKGFVAIKDRLGV